MYRVAIGQRRTSGKARRKVESTLKLEPVWCTARLVMRRPRPEDLGDVFVYASDPVVTHFTDWAAAADLPAVKDIMQGWDRDWVAGKEFTWVVTDRRTDQTIGAISCSQSGPEVSFGYVINRLHWGNGYATEVAIGLLQRVLAEPAVQLIRATCDEENLASRRVLEKAGLQFRGRAPRDIPRPQISTIPRPACLYERLR